MLPTTTNFETKLVIHASESYKLELPGLLCSDGYDQSELEKIADCRMLSNPVVQYQSTKVRGVLNGGKGLFLSATGKTLLNYSAGTQEQFDTAKSTRHLSGTTFWLGRPDSADFYYHWVLDELPRLRYLQEGGHDLGTVDHFLVRSNSKAFHRETLENTGVNPEKIVVVEDNVEYQFDLFIYIECGNGIGLKMNKKVPEYLKSLYQNSPTGEPAERIRLYVSRPASVRRHIVGEVDYIPYLIEAGFTVCQMEGLSGMGE